LFLSPVAGVWADRVNRQRLLMLIQTLAFVQALTLAVLTFSDLIPRPSPDRARPCSRGHHRLRDPDTAGVPSGADRAQGGPPNAIALQSLLFQSTRFVGPSVAGLVLAAFGEAGALS